MHQSPPETKPPEPRAARPATAPRRPGLRERKKAKTRRAIQDHALRLFRTQGYSATTVEQIADAAEVSPSTFFRYFPTKEDVVLYDALDPLLIDAYRRQPPELGPLEAMRGAMHEVWDGLSPNEIEGQLERGRLVMAEPALQQRYLVDILRTASMMSEMLAQRLGRDANEFEIRVTTGAAMGALLAAVMPAVLEEPAPDFVVTMDRAIDILKQGLVF